MNNKSWWRTLLTHQGGYAMIYAILAAAVISGLGIVMVNRATASVRQQQASVEADQSWYLAMAGIEHCMANLRWKPGLWEKIMVTDTATADERKCSGSLNGGTYNAQIAFSAPETVSIVSTGSKGRFTKTLTGLAKWGSGNPKENEGAVVAGGDWKFNGNTTIKGTLATTGSLDLLSNSVILCGQLYAAGTVNYTAANLDTTLSCNTSVQGNMAGIKLYDDTKTLNAIMTTPAYKHIGDMTCPGVNCKLNYATVYITGTLKFKGDYVFPRNNTMIVADKVEFNSPNGTVSAPPTAPPAKPAIYIYTVPGPEGSLTCSTMMGASGGVKKGYTRVDISSNYSIQDITFWSKTGLVIPASNVVVKGRIYSQCVEVNSTFTFEPGSALPPDTDVGLPGPPVYTESLWLLSVY